MNSRLALASSIGAWLFAPLVGGVLWVGGLVASTWVPPEVPWDCDEWDTLGRNSDPAACDAGRMTVWVDVLLRGEAVSLEAMGLAVAPSLALAVFVAVRVRRTRAVDSKARLAYRVALAQVLVVLGVAAIGSLLLLRAVAGLTIRG